MGARLIYIDQRIESSSYAGHEREVRLGTSATILAEGIADDACHSYGLEEKKKKGGRGKKEETGLASLLGHTA